MALVFSISGSSTFFESAFKMGLSFDDLILFVLPRPSLLSIPVPNIFILKGSKSNWLIINTTYATNVFFSEGIKVI